MYKSEITKCGWDDFQLGQGGKNGEGIYLGEPFVNTLFVRREYFVFVDRRQGVGLDTPLLGS